MTKTTNKKTVAKTDCCKKAKCDKPCAKTCAVESKESKCDARKVELGKVTDVIKKAPQWLVRAEAELKQLIERLQKLDDMLEKIIGSLGDLSWASIRKVRGTRDELAFVRLLMKQHDAMKAYKEVLEKRIELGKA